MRRDMIATLRRLARVPQRPPGSSSQRDWARLAGVLFALHLVWEVAQASLFTTFHEQPFPSAVLTCVAATVGDVVLSLGAAAAVGAIVRDMRWPFRAVRRANAAIWIGLGVGTTFVLEVFAVRLGIWSYTDAMPQLMGVGVSPLLQWIVVPVVSLGLGVPVRRSSQRRP